MQTWSALDFKHNTCATIVQNDGGRNSLFETSISVTQTCVQEHRSIFHPIIKQCPNSKVRLRAGCSRTQCQKKAWHLCPVSKRKCQIQNLILNGMVLARERHALMWELLNLSKQWPRGLTLGRFFEACRTHPDEPLRRSNT